MTKKDHIIRILEAMVGQRNLAEGLLAMLRKNNFDPTMVEILSKILTKAYKKANLLTETNAQIKKLKKNIG